MDKKQKTNKQIIYMLKTLKITSLNKEDILTSEQKVNIILDFLKLLII